MVLGDWLQKEWHICLSATITPVVMQGKTVSAKQESSGSAGVWNKAARSRTLDRF